MTARSDAELLQALREGNRAAGAELFARHAKASRALARRFGAGADTPDVVQEVWTQILRSPPELRGESLSGWLATTIRNRVARYRRSSARIGTLSSRHLPAAAGTSPTQRVAHDEQLRRVWRAIEAGELSDEELRLLALRYTSSSAEAGRELGVPASTYRGRARRVLEKLVQIVGLDG
jgi:RNA polymerase sigma factor (sigma-70 family)